MAERKLDSTLDTLKISKRDITNFAASLLLALGIWLLYNLSLSYSATLSTDVYAVTNLPGYYTKSAEAVTVEARCRASGYDMLRSKRKKRHKVITINLDPELFSPLGEGQFSLPSTVLSAHIGELFGNEARLESFTSPSYTFKFLEENCRTVPVVPVSSVSFKSQHMQKGLIKLEPDSVTVYGEPSFLENVDRIYTSRLSLSSLSSTKRGVLKLEKPRSVRLSVPEVRYTLEVVRFVELRRSIPVTVRNAPPGKELNVYPAASDVLFRCVFPYTVDRTGQLQLYVDYNDFMRSTDGKCVVRMGELPPGVVTAGFKPEVVECVEGTR